MNAANWLLLALPALSVCRHPDGDRAARSPSTAPPIHFTAREPSPATSARDADREGLLEDGDTCPLARESFNGYMDDDGCPDAPPPACPYGISPQVRFSPRSSVVPKHSISTLRTIAAALTEHPEHNLAVQGHAGRDEHDDEAARTRLGAQRARKVRDVLLRELRVAPERLVLRSLGAREPFPCGDDPLAQRRVDFVLVPAAAPRAYVGPSTPTR